MIKYYKEENNKLVEAPINFVNNDGSVICNFNINIQKMLEKGYNPYTDEEVQTYYANHNSSNNREDDYIISFFKIKS